MKKITRIKKFLIESGNDLHALFGLEYRKRSLFTQITFGVLSWLLFALLLPALAIIELYHHFKYKYYFKYLNWQDLRLRKKDVGVWK